MEEGIVAEALHSICVPAPVRPEKSFRKGDDSCLFNGSSFLTAERWGRQADNR